MYVGDDRAGRAKNPKFAAQSVFVRRLTHSRDFFEGGCARLLDKALDALDMALFDARVKPTASGRVYVNVIPPVEFEDAKELGPGVPEDPWWVFSGESYAVVSC